MANCRRHSVSYTPKMTPFEAYDLLPRELQVGAIAWGSYSTLRHYRKHGLKATIAWLRQGNRSEAKKPLIRGYFGRPNVENSYVEAGVLPLYPIRGNTPHE